MNILERYYLELKRNNKSDLTISAYLKDVNQFVDYLKGIGKNQDLDVVIEEIKYQDLDNYIIFLEKKYSKSSINRKLISLKSFFNYCEKYTEKNPAKKIGLYSNIQVKEKKVLTKEEVIRLLEQEPEATVHKNNTIFLDARDKFLIGLLATTGLRIEEALNIKFEDIEHFENYKIVNIGMHNNKTKLNKRVPICGKVLRLFENYMVQYEKKFEIQEENFLFVSSRTGKKIYNNITNESINKYAKLAGIGAISNHCFRHFANISLIALDTPDPIRKNILGWSCRGDMSSSVYFHITEDIEKKMVYYCSKILE